MITQLIRLTGNLPYWEGEIGVGEGLVSQCEVPPFGIYRLETVAQHHLAQQHTVLELLLANAVVRHVFKGVGVTAEVWVTLYTEPIERRTHLDACG